MSIYDVIGETTVELRMEPELSFVPSTRNGWHTLDWENNFIAYQSSERRAGDEYVRGICLLDVDNRFVSVLVEQEQDLSLAMSADGRLMAIGLAPRGLALWDMDANRPIDSLTGHSNWVVSLAFSPDGRRLASGAGDSTVRVWDVGSATEIECLEVSLIHGVYVDKVEFSLDGRLLAAECEEAVIVWDVSSW